MKDEVKNKTLSISKFYAGFTLVILGAIIIFTWPNLFGYLLNKQLQLRPGSLSHQVWSDPPQPLYMDIYFFNWTNPHDITNKSTKPIFKEIGPFRFQEFPQKVNVTWHDQNDTVSYRKQSRYVFMPEQSNGKLDDVITSVNVIALSSAVQTRGWNLFKVKGIEISLNAFGQKIFTTKTVDEWLFQGYDDPIIPTAAMIAKLIGVGDIPFDRFGWFYQRNESSLLTGAFNVDTGVDDINKFGQLRTWNYAPTTSFFDSQCSKLQGSGGEFFPPGTTRNQTISIFSAEMCRSVILEYQSDLDIHGVETLKFIGGERTLDNGTIYPENKCYCSGDCVPSGLFNVSSCRFGAPVFMSFPHFYNADPFYRQQVEGMQPEKDKHEFYVALEPKTSLPLEIAARFQLNLLIDPIPRLKMYKDVPRLFMPVLWFEQHVKAPPTMALVVKLVLNAPVIGQIVGLLTVILGVLLITWNVRSIKQYYDSNDNLHKTTSSHMSVLQPLVTKK